MPDLIACPACGCRVQMMDAMLGRRTRCVACGEQFLAGAPPAPRPEPEPDVIPVQPLDLDEAARPDRARNPRPALCPCCGRVVTWDAAACPGCGLYLEPDRSAARWSGHRRRDQEPHRGPLIAALGKASLLVGVCTCGVALPITLGLGVPAWVMANHDLELMRTGQIDPDGREPTENGRAAALAGIFLALAFGACFAFALWTSRF
jgi:hypothetical protein